jgi:AcrR family transcriptional regulator
MPRPLRERLILDVAGGVFARDGYHGTSMDEIARLADVSKPMLYAYFGSKEQLYVAYIDRTGHELVDRLIAADPQHERASERLRLVIAEFLSFVAEHDDGWRVLFSESTASRPLAEHVTGLRGQVVAEVRRMLEGGARSPQAGLAAPASDGVAHAIVGAGESLANWWLGHPEVPMGDVAELYLGLVQAAISAATPPRG